MRWISTRAGDKAFARASIEDEAFEEYDEGGDTIAPEDKEDKDVSFRSWSALVDIEMGEEDFWSVEEGLRLCCRLVDSGVGVCALMVVSAAFL